jgi:hypothetical protein
VGFIRSNLSVDRLPLLLGDRLHPTKGLGFAKKVKYENHIQFLSEEGDEEKS